MLTIKLPYRSSSINRGPTPQRLISQKMDKDNGKQVFQRTWKCNICLQKGIGKKTQKEHIMGHQEEEKIGTQAALEMNKKPDN